MLWIDLITWLCKWWVKLIEFFLWVEFNWYSHKKHTIKNITTIRFTRQIGSTWPTKCDHNMMHMVEMFLSLSSFFFTLYTDTYIEIAALLTKPIHKLQMTDVYVLALPMQCDAMRCNAFYRMMLYSLLLHVISVLLL